MFVVADTEMRILRQHLRNLLTVVGPDGSALFFRYYDPRVLAPFLPTCEDDQLDEVFGPAQAFGAVDQDSGDLTLFRR